MQRQPATPLHRLGHTETSLADSMAIQPSMAYVERVWAEPVQFSSMSDDQIAEALNRVGNEFDPDLNMVSWDDAAALDWLNWSNLPEFGA